MTLQSLTYPLQQLTSSEGKRSEIRRTGSFESKVKRMLPFFNGKGCCMDLPVFRRRDRYPCRHWAIPAVPYNKLPFRCTAAFRRDLPGRLEIKPAVTSCRSIHHIADILVGITFPVFPFGFREKLIDSNPHESIPLTVLILRYFLLPRSAGELSSAFP